MTGARPSSWPSVLWVVRHGQSAGNVARDLAHSSGAARIDLQFRDVDVPLSELGAEQAASLGKWFAERVERPEVMLASPYLRARQTAEIFRDLGGCDDDEAICADERLREKEFGVLDRLTKHGIMMKYPEQAEIRAVLGKFYHRPPGGESWCDVILRLRSALEMVSREYCGCRVLIVCHSVVVLCLRYLLEHTTEEEILAIDRDHEVANCSVTSYLHDPTRKPRGQLVLETFNFVAPLEAAGAPVTSSPDAKVAAK